MEDIYSTKTAAMSFVHELCKARAKGSLDMLMAVRPRPLLHQGAAGMGAGHVVRVVWHAPGMW